jgi:hypothetical protein
MSTTDPFLAAAEREVEELLAGEPMSKPTLPPAPPAPKESVMAKNDAAPPAAPKNDDAAPPPPAPPAPPAPKRKPLDAPEVARRLAAVFTKDGGPLVSSPRPGVVMLAYSDAVHLGTRCSSDDEEIRTLCDVAGAEQHEIKSPSQIVVTYTLA